MLHIGSPISGTLQLHYLMEVDEPDDELVSVETAGFCQSRRQQPQCERQRPSGASFCKRGSLALCACTSHSSS
jgi:hypothetical protein